MHVANPFPEGDKSGMLFPEGNRNTCPEGQKGVMKNASLVRKRLLEGKEKALEAAFDYFAENPPTGPDSYRRCVFVESRTLKPSSIICLYSGLGAAFPEQLPSLMMITKEYMREVPLSVRSYPTDAAMVAGLSWGVAESGPENLFTEFLNFLEFIVLDCEFRIQEHNGLSDELRSELSEALTECLKAKKHPAAVKMLLAKIYGSAPESKEGDNNIVMDSEKSLPGIIVSRLFYYLISRLETRTKLRLVTSL